VDSRGDNFFIKQNWLRKLFNWTAKGEPPQDVDPVAHRYALRMAFCITAVYYSAILVIRIYRDLAIIWTRPEYMNSEGAYYAINFFSGFLPAGILRATLIFFLVYAVFLRRWRNPVPPQMYPIIIALIVAGQIAAIPYNTIANYGGFFPPIASALALVLGGHLVSRQSQILLRLGFTALVISPFYALAFIYASESLSRHGLDFAAILAPDLLKLLWLPFAVLLPCSLLASLRPPTNKTVRLTSGRKLGPVEISLMLLVGSAALMFLSYISLPIPDKLALPFYMMISLLSEGYWITPVVLLVLYAYAQKLGNAAQRFAGYLLLATTVFVVLENGTLPNKWDVVYSIFSLFLISALPLWMFAGKTERRLIVRAYGLILLNCAFLLAWIKFAYLPTALLVDSFANDVPALLAMKFAVICLIVIAFVPATVLLSWRLIRPGDVDGLIRS
jgi:hypothetical protein